MKREFLLGLNVPLLAVGGYALASSVGYASSIGDIVGGGGDTLEFAVIDRTAEEVSPYSWGRGGSSPYAGGPDSIAASPGCSLQGDYWYCTNEDRTHYAYDALNGAGSPPPIDVGDVAVHTKYADCEGGPVIPFDTIIFLDSPPTLTLPKSSCDGSTFAWSVLVVNDVGDCYTPRMSRYWLDVYTGRCYLDETHTLPEGSRIYNCDCRGGQGYLDGDGTCTVSYDIDSCAWAYDMGVGTVNYHYHK